MSNLHMPRPEHTASSLVEPWYRIGPTTPPMLTDTFHCTPWQTASWGAHSSHTLAGERGRRGGPRTAVCPTVFTNATVSPSPPRPPHGGYADVDMLVSGDHGAPFLLQLRGGEHRREAIEQKAARHAPTSTAGTGGAVLERVWSSEVIHNFKHKLRVDGAVVHGAWEGADGETGTSETTSILITGPAIAVRLNAEMVHRGVPEVDVAR